MAAPILFAEIGSCQDTATLREKTIEEDGEDSLSASQYFGYTRGDWLNLP